MAVFTEGILGQPPEPISIDVQARSLGSFFSALDGVFRGLHLNSDAEGLVIVADSDDSDLHELDYDKAENERCRFCKIRRIIGRAQSQLKARRGRTELKVAIGLAVPAIEAWYLVGENHEVGEAQWKQALSSDRLAFSRPQLKNLVYGTDRPSLEHETDCAVAEARRIIADPQAIESAFPIGFGLTAQAIRSWKS